jgi:glutamate/tyrosine decarboxylase-like PLP-dependent enzyme
MRLSKNELVFIENAARLVAAVFDFENFSNEEFKEIYGMSMATAYEMAEKLGHKTQVEIDRRKNKKRLK